MQKLPKLKAENKSCKGIQKRIFFLLGNYHDAELIRR